MKTVTFLLRRKNMKALALETIVAAIIAMAGMITFLYLTGFFKNASNWFYCNVFLKIQSLFSGQKISVPEACKDYIKEELKIEEIDESDNRIVSRMLLAYIINCWNEAEVKGLNKDHACYEIHLKRSVDNVTEANVTKVLIEEDRCKSIENSDYGCGVQDQILWGVEGEAIRNQEIILIRYNSKENAIEVVG
jgi:hypothetical protein